MTGITRLFVNGNDDDGMGMRLLFAIFQPNEWMHASGKFGLRKRTFRKLK
jgi:hypothetical protein